MSLIPLSGSGLCDAVTISPTAKPPLRRDRRAANAPMRKKVESSSSALARKPAVPYASGTFGPSGPREVGMGGQGVERGLFQIGNKFEKLYHAFSGVTTSRVCGTRLRAPVLERPGDPIPPPPLRL